MMISFLSCVTHAERIEIFTTKAYPVALNGLQAKVCELDALNTIKDDLNRNERSIASFNQVDTVQNVHLTTFYRCQARASDYALSSLPAIVLDKKYVVYGMRAADKAVYATRRFKEVHHA